ncbi:baseplate J/gp47 family protein [Dictyobacter kobayashii]|uniref:Baseplate protein J-like barrel domain-containing protein n=1 Tax=Dictyobacter kobayashii TaxID=2014872 RepID=A0A402AGG0_9CHLR|nr:baseplate J/gp47 family protein [Dictyobacter kobayashii]GCE18211.1 hypothetical protein KDK_20110 [Dictyobacter kobayashii]
MNVEQLQTRKVTLVVPAQTQLRSHVAWKLLYARARELGKDVLIVSSDPQVRSVAHAVKFNVAHSLETSQQGRSRPTGRPVRNGSPTNRARPGGTSQRPTGGRAARSTNTLRPRQAGSRNSANLENQNSEREQLRQQPPSAPHSDPSSTFQLPEEDYEQPYDYQMHATPPIRPLSPDQIEEPDLLLEDYALTQNIRMAAGEANSDPGFEAPASQARSKKEARPTSKSQASHQSLDAEDGDPFLAMEDKQPPPIVEQRGGAVIEGPSHYDHVIQDVSEAPTSIIGNQFDFDADEDDVLPPPRSKGAKNRDRQATSKEARQPANKESNIRELPRQSGEATRQRRSGKMVPPAAMTPSQRLRAEDLDDDDLPPVQDRPTQIQDRDAFIYESPSRTSHKSPDSIALPGGRPRSYGARSGQMQRPAAEPRQAQATSLRPSGVLRPSKQLPTGRPSQDLRSRKPQPLRKPGKKRGNALVWIIAAIFICLVLAVGLGAYLLPTATATITIAAQNYSQPISVLASPDTVQGAIPAHQLVHEFTKTSAEPVTGNRLVGTAKASGNVCFSNNGGIDIIIPTGSDVSTPGANGVLFKTTAEVSIPKQTLCTNVPLPVPVEAVQPGESGNVQAGSVTIIPDTTLDSIAKANNTTTAQLKLSVINTDDIKGGGMEPVAAVADKDLTNARNDLHKQLQGEIDAWVKSLPQNGALGPVTTTDTLVNPPTKDTIIQDGKTFPAQISVKATVLFVNNTDLQNAARTQLTSAMQKDKAFAKDVILSDAKQPISISKLKQQPAGKNELKLNYTATAMIGGAFDENALRQQIAGQTADSANHLLKLNNKGIQNTHIDIQPGFFPWLPFYSNHIDIKVVPGTVPLKG